MRFTLENSLPTHLFILEDDTKSFYASSPSANCGTIIIVNQSHQPSTHAPDYCPASQGFPHHFGVHLPLQPYLLPQYDAHSCLVPFLTHRLPHRLSDVLTTINDTPHIKLSRLTNTSPHTLIHSLHYQPNLHTHTSALIVLSKRIAVRTKIFMTLASELAECNLRAVSVGAEV
ncbi:hypothetical protein DFJ58DRAFT_326747 [Suillus subalutaceus]|uniref:uncharacterized protein n=1 Tax=Suillus subalutaceus TaxID=48586 RepID=UPI001B880C09|nr:uncharacterized protein DFJ58DRAFT_326747 [Suillus subalutaceus]KAG1857751.1 hypothetical protein DFJ58DRAFT_326747 [Suillus subalutaceus]